MFNLLMSFKTFTPKKEKMSYVSRKISTRARGKSELIKKAGEREE
jgi:hypothetical protein